MISRDKIKNKFINFSEKIKAFVHRHDWLDKFAFFVFGILWLIRSKIIFRGLRKKVTEQASKKETRKSKILVLAIRAIPSTSLVYFDAMFGHGFSLAGAEVLMLYCDGLMDSCDADTVFRNQKAQCYSCRKLGCYAKKFLGLENLNCVSYKDYITDRNISNIRSEAMGLEKSRLFSHRYLGVETGLHAKIATIRFFLDGRLDLNDLKQEAVFREKLFYAMIAAKVASKIIEKENPDTIFMLHGIYSSWGPFLSYFKQKGKDTYVYDNKLSKLGYFTFHHNAEPYQIFGRKAWLDFSRFPLAKEEELQLKDYLGERFKGKLGEYSMYKGDFGNQKAKNSALESLFKKNYEKKYVMYPGVAWDGSIKGYTSEVFEDMFDWLDKTIEFFKKNKNYRLIVKSHPAEIITDKCNTSVAVYLEEKHGPLPENIIVLVPDTAVRAYDLMSPDLVSITYDGTIGLELALMGLPVLVAGDSHYREAGVVKKLETLDEYFKLLEDHSELVSFAKSHVELAKKYAYFYFFKSMARVPFYSRKKWSVVDWEKISDEKELFSEEGDFMKICRKIVEKKDIISPL